MVLTLTAPYPEDVDTAAISALLKHEGLTTSTSSPLLVDASGHHPLLDGQHVLFEVSYLGPQSPSFYATVWSDHRGPQLAQLLFDLADQGRLVITPEPAPPHIITCGDFFADDDIYYPNSAEICVRAGSAADLAEILSGRWQDHRIRGADQ